MKRINKNILYIAYFVSIIIIGSIGFYIIGGDGWSWLDSIYMTIITLFFVGFSEVHPLTDLGRIWAIFWHHPMRLIELRILVPHMPT